MADPYADFSSPVTAPSAPADPYAAFSTAQSAPVTYDPEGNPESTGQPRGMKPVLEDLMTRAASSASFGLAEKGAAALRSALGKGTYEENLARNRAETEAAGQRLGLAGQVIGDVAGGVGAGSLLSRAGVTIAGRIPQTAGTLAKILGGAAEGAGYGAAEAAGHTDTGQLADYLKNAAQGAGIGAATGGALSSIPATLTRPVGTPQQLARQGLGETFNVPLTRGDVTGSVKQLRAEDQILHGGRGVKAQEVLKGAREQQGAALAEAGQSLRTELTGVPAPMSPPQIGQQISTAYREARAAAKQNVSGFYDMAFDPEALGRRGISSAVPLETIAGLPNALEHAFVHSNQYGGALIPTRSSTPNAYSAIQMLRRFSQDGSIPSAFPKVTAAPAGSTELNWQGVDMVRKQLVGLARGVSQQNGTDRAAMQRIISTFDEHFGAANPLLNEARARYAQYANTFDPGRFGAKGVSSSLRALQNSENPGQTIYNTLFSGAPMKRGEAGPLIDRFKSMFAETPEAMQALREGAMNRLLNDTNTFQPLSPQKTATNINNALNGPQAEIYRSLFSPDELQKLGQYKDLSQLIAKNAGRQNASGTSYPLMRRMAQSLGATAGGSVGFGLAGPYGAAVGVPLGAAAGGGVDSILSARIANKAVSPSRLWSAPTPSPISSPAVIGGLLSPSQMRGGLLQ